MLLLPDITEIVVFRILVSLSLNVDVASAAMAEGLEQVSQLGRGDWLGGRGRSTLCAKEGRE